MKKHFLISRLKRKDALSIFLFYLILILFFHLPIKAQIISFPEQWLFKIGDESNFKEPKLNDSDWTRIKVPSSWENAGFNFDGIAWYRLHFSLEKKYLNKDFYLLVGKIDDIDETYLNGKLIGKTGKFPPNAESGWNIQRAYKIPRGFLKEQNVLAIRVFDMGGPGGIYSGSIGIYDKYGYIKELNLKPGPKKSFHQLVTSNGLICAVYSEKEDLIESIYPHIFAAYDSSKMVSPFLTKLKLDTKQKLKSVSYVQNTHIISVKYDSFDVNYFAPFTLEQKIFFAVVLGRKDQIENLSFHFSSGKAEVISDELMLSVDNDLYEKYFLFSFNDSLHNNAIHLLKTKAKLINDQISLVDREVKFMKTIHDNCKIPLGMSREERNLFEQSITILKMARVSEKEIFEKSRGQILASLPPGMWNITWVRDAVYSINALIKLGLFDEAKSSLRFFLNADVGYYKNYIHSDNVDYGIESDYLISVCRYFGIGKEETDFNQNGPNIELDGFGLFLWAFCNYIFESKDYKFAVEYFNKVSSMVADVIVNSIKENNLIRKDSGPWERHLPGKQYAFTSIVCAYGLNLFIKLCDSLNLGSSEKYRQGLNRLQKGILENLLTKKKFIKSNFDITDKNKFDYYDASTFEAFNFDIINDKALFKAHLVEYESNLRLKDRGFFRVNNGDWYDRQEWVFLDLRIASAMKKFGMKNKSKELINWIVKQSSLNHNLIAELYNEKTSAYAGAVPMVGFGAGAFILYMSKP